VPVPVVAGMLRARVLLWSLNRLLTAHVYDERTVVAVTVSDSARQAGSNPQCVYVCQTIQEPQHACAWSESGQLFSARGMICGCSVSWGQRLPVLLPGHCAVVGAGTAAADEDVASDAVRRMQYGSTAEAAATLHHAHLSE
jgi:hypothetical protein